MVQQETALALKSWLDNPVTLGSPLVNHPVLSDYLTDIMRCVDMPGHETRINLQPCLDENTSRTPIDKYYFYQDTWTARKIFKINPCRLVDIGSTALLVGIVSQSVQAHATVVPWDKRR